MGRPEDTDCDSDFRSILGAKGRLKLSNFVELSGELSDMAERREHLVLDGVLTLTK